MDRIIRSVLLGLVLILVAACTSTPPVMPTEIASATPLPPTATITPTRTPFPTATATIPAPRMNADRPQDQAYVRFVNAARDAGTVDFYVDGFNFAGFMDPATFTDQVGLVAGQYRLTAVAQTSGDPDDPLAQASLTLLGGDSVIVILGGTAADAQLILVKEDLSPVAGDQTRLTLVNALDETPLSLNNGSSVVNSETAFGAASAPSLVSAGSLQLNVRSGGQIVYADEITRRPRQNTTVIALKRSDPGDVELLLLTTPVTGISEVQFVNAIRTFPIDIVLDGTTVAEGVGDLVVTSPQKIAARDYEVLVYRRDSEGPSEQAVLQTTLRLDPDKSVYVIVAGSEDAARLFTYTLDTSPVATGTARLAFINILPDSPRLSITSNMNVDEIVGYGQVSNQLVIPSGALPLVISRSTNDPSVSTGVENQPEFSIEAGTDNLYFVTGRNEQAPFVITNPVGVIADAVVDAQQPADEPNTAPSIYPINALDGLAIEFRSDDVPLGAALNPRTSGLASLITSGEHTFTALRPDTGELLARYTSTTTADRGYTLVMTQRNDQYQLLILENTPRSGTSPTVRLINLSDGNTPFGLSLAANNGTTNPFPDLSAAIDETTGTIPFRNSYIIGLQRIITEIYPSNSSDITAISLEPDVYDFYTVDDTETTIANVTPAIALEENRHYDVLVYQSTLSRQVTVSVLPAPLRAP